MIQLQLKAKHFKRTRFNNPCNCAISKAAKEHFVTNDVSERLSGIGINGKYYNHGWYELSDFQIDHETARSHNFDETVIRTITLKRGY